MVSFCGNLFMSSNNDMDKMLCNGFVNTQTYDRDYDYIVIQTKDYAVGYTDTKLILFTYTDKLYMFDIDFDLD